MSHPSLARLRPTLAGPAVAVGLLLLLTGCSTSSATEPAGATTEAAAPKGADQARGELPGGGGVSGTIAAVSGAILQVQDTDSQTAVTYTADTVITQTIAAALDQVAVGSCVVAISAAGADDTATSTAATTVRITTAVDGACETGFGGGLPDGAAPEDMPEGMPTDLPTDMPEGARGGGFVQPTSGLVTAVAETTITVTATSQDGTTSTETIEVDASTVFTASVTADAATIAVGLCAAVQGESDDGGELTATSLTLSQPGDDGCTQAMGMGGMGRGPGGNGGASAEGTTNG